MERGSNTRRRESNEPHLEKPVGCYETTGPRQKHPKTSKNFDNPSSSEWMLINNINLWSLIFSQNGVFSCHHIPWRQRGFSRLAKGLRTIPQVENLARETRDSNLNRKNLPIRRPMSSSKRQPVRTKPRRKSKRGNHHSINVNNRKPGK